MYFKEESMLSKKQAKNKKSQQKNKKRKTKYRKKAIKQTIKRTKNHKKNKHKEKTITNVDIPGLGFIFLEAQPKGIYILSRECHIIYPV
jgi:hypothetical protein